MVRCKYTWGQLIELENTIAEIREALWIIDEAVHVEHSLNEIGMQPLHVLVRSSICATPILAIAHTVEALAGHPMCYILVSKEQDSLKCLVQAQRQRVQMGTNFLAHVSMPPQEMQHYQQLPDVQPLLDCHHKVHIHPHLHALVYSTVGQIQESPHCPVASMCSDMCLQLDTLDASDCL